MHVLAHFLVGKGHSKPAVSHNGTQFEAKLKPEGLLIVLQLTG